MRSEERDKKYVDECGLSHPQTNQLPLGNKNVVSVIVNYKYWSLPYCSLQIMLNGLPLNYEAINAVCECVCVHVYVREKDCMSAYLRKYAIIFFMALKAPVPSTKFTCSLSVCSSVSDVSDQTEELTERKQK